MEAKNQAADRWKLARAQVKSKLASDQLAAGHVRDAAGELSEALRLDPKNPRLFVMQARVSLAQGDATAAQALLDSLLARSEADVDATTRAEAHYIAGVIAQQRLRWDAALESFVRATELDRSEIAYVVAVAQAQLQSGHARDAVDTLTARESEFGFTNAYHAALAECCEQLGDWPAAAAAWRQIGGDGADTGVQERLATALYHAGNYAEAGALLETLVGTDRNDGPTTATTPHRENLRLMLAECLLEDGQLEEARTQAGRVVHAQPRNTTAFTLLARIHAEIGRYPDALDAAERALKIDLLNRPALELASALAYRLGNRARAVTLAQRLVTLPGEQDNPIGRQILAISQVSSQPKIGIAGNSKLDRSE